MQRPDMYCPRCESLYSSITNYGTFGCRKHTGKLISENGRIKYTCCPSNTTPLDYHPRGDKAVCRNFGFNFRVQPLQYPEGCTPCDHGIIEDDDGNELTITLAGYQEILTSAGVPEQDQAALIQRVSGSAENIQENFIIRRVQTRKRKRSNVQNAPETNDMLESESDELSLGDDTESEEDADDMLDDTLSDEDAEEYDLDGSLSGDVVEYGFDDISSDEDPPNESKLQTFSSETDSEDDSDTDSEDESEVGSSDRYTVVWVDKYENEHFGGYYWLMEKLGYTRVEYPSTFYNFCAIWSWFFLVVTPPPWKENWELEYLRKINSAFAEYANADPGSYERRRLYEYCRAGMLLRYTDDTTENDPTIDKEIESIAEIIAQGLSDDDVNKTVQYMEDTDQAYWMVSLWAIAQWISTFRGLKNTVKLSSATAKGSMNDWIRGAETPYHISMVQHADDGITSPFEYGYYCSQALLAKFNKTGTPYKPSMKSDAKKIGSHMVCVIGNKYYDTFAMPTKPEPRIVFRDDILDQVGEFHYDVTDNSRKFELTRTDHGVGIVTKNAIKKNKILSYAFGETIQVITEGSDEANTLLQHENDKNESINKIDDAHLPYLISAHRVIETFHIKPKLVRVQTTIQDPYNTMWGFANDPGIYEGYIYTHNPRGMDTSTLYGRFGGVQYKAVPIGRGKNITEVISNISIKLDKIDKMNIKLYGSMNIEDVLTMDADLNNYDRIAVVVSTVDPLDANITVIDHVYDVSLPIDHMYVKSKKYIREGDELLLWYGIDYEWVSELFYTDNGRLYLK